MSITDFAIVRRSLLGRPFLSVTTLLTVAVAVALLLTLLETKDAGFRALIRGGGNMQLLVSRDDSALVSVLNGVFFANAPRRALEWANYEDIASRFPLEYAIPTLLGDSYQGSPVMATTPAMFDAYAPDPEGAPWTFAEGRAFETNWEVVAGAQAARTHRIRLGDTLALTHGFGVAAEHDDDDHHHDDAAHDAFEFSVVGLLEPTGTPSDRALFISLESSWVLHAHDRRVADDPAVTTTEVADLVDDDRKITGIYLRVRSRSGSMLSGAMQQVFDQLRRDTSITVAQPANQVRRLLAVVGGVEEIFTALVGVVLVSSAIAIALALYNSTEHRRRQIAVLRVLGFTRRRIVGLVLTESAMLGLAGGLVGIMISMGGILLVATLLRAHFGLDLQPALVSRSTLPVLALAIAMSIVAGLVPAVLAYRVPVVRNLAPLG